MPGLETAVEQRARAARSTSSPSCGGRTATAGGAAGDPHVWLDPVRYAEMVRLIGRRAREGGAGGTPGPQARRARRRVPTRPRPLRTPPDRDEPRRLRLSRGPLRARAGAARRAHARGGAVGEGHRPARRRRPRAPARRPSSSRRSSRRSSPRPSRARPASKTAVLDPLEGISDERDRCRRRLLLGHAREPRHPAEGTGMHELSSPSSSSTASRSGTGPASACSRTSRSRSRRASSLRSPGRTAAARRRCCGSCSGSSARATGTVRVFGEPPARVATAAASATSPSGRGSSARRR